MNISELKGANFEVGRDVYKTKRRGEVPTLQ